MTSARPARSELGERVLSRMPHKPPMLILDDVEQVGAMHIVCKARIGADHILLHEGRVSSFFAVELFAQSAAALMVHRALAGGQAPTTGMLLGTRKITLRRGAFALGDEVTVRAEEIWGAGALAQFSGRAEIAGALVAEGSINVMTGHAAS